MGLCINIASFLFIENQFLKIDKLDISVKILSIKEEKEYVNKYIVKIIDCEAYKKIEKKKIIMYVKKEKTYLPGDILYIKGEFSIPEEKRNYGGFDYKKYLKQKKIFGIIEVEKCCKIGNEKDIFCIVENLRLEFLNRIDKLYKQENSEFLKSLLLGKTDELSVEIEENFRDSSISHVLAISGMHTSYVIIGINFLLEKLLKNKIVKNYILIFLLILFSIITGSSVSCIRACIMSSIVLVASILNQKDNFYRSFIFSLIVIILYNPYNIYNTGMWLSYMGSLGIVSIYSFLEKYFLHKLKKNRTKNMFKNVIFKNLFTFIFKNFLITCSAQILIFPIMLYVFNTISISFFISNVSISFFVGPLLIFGYVSIIVSYIIFPFSKIIVFIEEVLIFLILKISEICARLPLSKIYIITPSVLTILSYYFIILIIIYMFQKKKFYMIKLLNSKKFFKKIVKEKFMILYNKAKRLYKFYRKKVIIILFFCLFLNRSFINVNQSKLKINFVDVGQGDCTYIVTPNGKNIIIDGGEGNTEKYDYGKNVVLPYLLDKKVYKIDYLIISHADSDHIGGLFAVLENIKVNKILIGIQPEFSKQLEDLLKVAEKNKIEIILLKAGDKINLEKNVELYVLWPINNRLIDENPLNNNSLVFKIIYNNFSMLFTGDIEEVAEKQISDKYQNNNSLRSTVLKVAHHGSRTSSMQGFIDIVKPKIALIGVGKNNTFGHPNKEVLDRLKQLRYTNM